jgi:hypothetical protein
MLLDNELEEYKKCINIVALINEVKIPKLHTAS